MNLKEASEVAGVGQARASMWASMGILRIPGRSGVPGVALNIGPQQLRELKVLARLRAALPTEALSGALEYLRAAAPGRPPVMPRRYAVLKGLRRRGRCLVGVADGPEQMADVLSKHSADTLLFVPFADVELPQG